MILRELRSGTETNAPASAAQAAAPPPSVAPGATARARAGRTADAPFPRLPPLQRRLLDTQRRLAATFEEMVSQYRFSDAEFGRRYYEEYQAEFHPPPGGPAGAPRIVTEEALLRDLTERDIVFLGDYHTLRASQETALWILRTLFDRGRDVTLLLEMFRAADQRVIDHYLSGRIRSDRTFLARVNYRKTWGFDWSNVRDLMHFARRRHVRVIGLNTARDRHRPDAPSLLQRDAAAARAVAREASRAGGSRGSLLLVVFGDAHVAASHLPREVESLLAAEGASRRVAVVHQNADALYWRLREAGEFFFGHHALCLDDRRFVLFNTNPLAKFQSYLIWEVNAGLLSGEPGGAADDLAGSPELLDELLVLAYDTVRRFWGFDAPGFDAAIHFGRDLSFLSGLKQQRLLRAAVERMPGFFLSERTAIYLSDLSFDIITEVVSYYLMDLCRRAAMPRRDPAGAPRVGAPGGGGDGSGNGHAPNGRAARRGKGPKRQSQVDRFYDRAIGYALGFLNSRLLNPERRALDEEGHRRFLDDYHREVEKTPAATFQADGSHAFMQHRRLERAFEALAGGPAGARRSFLSSLHLDPLFRLPEILELSATRQIGYRLGAAMFDALVSRDEVRAERAFAEAAALFCDPLDERNAARTRYFELYQRYLA